METPFTQSADSENIYKAGYKVPWIYYLVMVMISLLLLGYIAIFVIGIMFLSMVIHGTCDMLPDYFLYNMVRSFVLTSVLTTVIVFYSRWIRNLSRYGSLLISPLGLSNKVGYYRVDSISWSEVLQVTVTRLSRHSQIYIKLAHGWIILKGDTLLDTEQTIKLIRQYAGLDVEKPHILWTKYVCSV